MHRLLLLSFFLSGCALFGGKGGDEPAGKGDEAGHAAPAPDPVRVRAGNEQELKLARLWARVDELEEEAFRQKERIRVLEKGMTLGLVPEELRRPGKAPAKGQHTLPDAEPAPPPVHMPQAAAAPPEGEAVTKGEAKAEAKGPKGPGNLNKEEAEKYQQMLANAHDHYKAGRYGRAIVEYESLGKAFGDKVPDGMHVYWIAKSWIGLKEYNTAYQHLTEFLKDHGTSPWAPRAKLELARVEWQLDHRESAMQLFRDVIETYPNADAAEMAKMELENLPKKL